jgi:lipopolysaccharide biosynthesis glycosyltransferase
MSDLKREAEALKSKAVVFVTDRGFLVPSLVAALQVMQQITVTTLSDVIVVLIDFNPMEIATVEKAIEGDGIILLPMDSALFLPPDGTFFNGTHVPKSALGRLALHHVLPKHYEDVVYIDGDVQITGDLTALVRHRVMPGFVAAVAEGNWLCEGDIGTYWPAHKAYMENLGVHDPRTYFNSGVLAFRLETWREFAPMALDYFIRYPERCLYHDQSALNAVFAGRVQPLSPRYNYLSLYAALGIDQEIRPKIIHFTGGNKPWIYTGPPWSGRFTDIYRQFISEHPVLAGYLDLDTASSARDMTLADRIKQWLLLPWRRNRRRRMLRSYVKSGEFAFTEGF